MAMMKFKNSNGEWMSIPAFRGEPGKDGAVQYKAGDGIKIENDTITAEVTKDYLDGKLEELADIGFTPEISESLPTENIDANTIYMIPSQDGEGDNIYEEWMYINNKWEKIGSTGVNSNSMVKEYVWDLNATNYMNTDNITLTNAQKTSLISVLNQIITDGSASYYNLIVMNSNSTAVNKVGNKYHIISDNHSSKSYKLAFLGTSASNKTLELSGISFMSYTDGELPYVYKMAMKLTGVYTDTNGLITSITTGTITARNGAIAVYGSYWSGRTPTYSNDPVTLGYLLNNTLKKTNTTEYTPTSDYHPATKKYVDDAVASMEAPESNIVDLDISGFKSNMFEMSGSGTGYASSNEHVKAALEKIARLGEANCIILIHNPYGAALCSFTSHYNHSNGGFGAYYTGIYQEQASGSNGVKYSVTIMYSSDGSPANIKVQSDTLEGYITPNNVLAKTNTKAFTPTANYHPATKKYVDDALANIPQGSGDTKGFYTYKVDLGNIGFAGEIDDYGWITHMVTDQCKTEINDLINKMLTDDIGQPLVVIENTNAEADLKSMLLFGFDCDYDPDTMQNLDFTLHGVANYVGSATGSLMMKYENAVMFAGSGIVTDGVWDATALAIAVTTQQSLTTDNQMEYVPTGDYNPATKKYVDDAVAGASGGITSESDPVFKASEAYKITSTDTANWNNKVDINAVNNAINSTLSSKSYLTSEKDPTVPAWAKQPNKPTYTASEVGALPASTVIPTVPTKLSGFTDDLGTSPKHSHSQYLTAHQDISGKQNKVLYGTVDPTSDVGAEGDIYIKYV